MNTVTKDGITFVNLTPHNINVVDKEGNTVVSIPPAGVAPRINEREIETKTVAGISVAVVETDPSEAEKVVQDVANEFPGAVIIVSLAVLSSIKKPDNATVVAPDTFKGAVRDEKGRIVGVTRFRTMR